MSPAAKQTIAVTVVGVLVLSAVITFFAELHSSENDAKIFGSAAFVAALVFCALGWAKRKR